MKKKNVIFAVSLLMLLFALCAFAADEQINKAHLDNGLECADCHETDIPEKRANQRLCIDCHGGKTDDKEVKTLVDANGTKAESAIHTSHAGQLRCTLCHAVHKQSTLYCNEGCHHTWQLITP